ncbi:hypothetical protein QTP88_010608 [Uroleucon formosanum]
MGYFYVKSVVADVGAIAVRCFNDDAVIMMDTRYNNIAVRRVCPAVPQPTVSQCRPPAFPSGTRTGRVIFNLYGGYGYLSLCATCIHTRDLALSSFSLTQTLTHTRTHIHTPSARSTFNINLCFVRRPPPLGWSHLCVCLCVTTRSARPRRNVTVEYCKMRRR